MHGAPSVHVDLVPSRMALFGIVVAATATSGAVLTLPWPLAATVAAVLAIVAWAVDRVRVVALRRGSRAVRGVEITAGLRLRASYGDGTVRIGRLDQSTCVTPRITTIVWRPDGCRFARAVLILPDMLPSEDFRRLRVTLRYGRSDATQGAPASHA
ncbi:MAG TPA: protein YgfX [Casimicrobiaceae bacterium]